MFFPLKFKVLLPSISVLNVLQTASAVINLFCLYVLLDPFQCLLYGCHIKIITQ
jgi:hypothetical protein